jgi:hypothetical protein
MECHRIECSVIRGFKQFFFFFFKSNQKEYSCLLADSLTILKKFKLICYDFMFSFLSLSLWTIYLKFSQSPCVPLNGFSFRNQTILCFARSSLFFPPPKQAACVYVLHAICFSREYIFFSVVFLTELISRSDAFFICFWECIIIWLLSHYSHLSPHLRTCCFVPKLVLVYLIFTLGSCMPFFVFVIFFQIAALVGHLSFIYGNGSQIGVNEYIDSVLTFHTAHKKKCTLPDLLCKDFLIKRTVWVIFLYLFQ